MTRKADRALLQELEPRLVHLRAGEPASVTFHHTGASRPSRDILVFPCLGRLVTLPKHADVVVEFPALRAGEYDFCFRDGTCAGTLIVDEAGRTG